MPEAPSLPFSSLGRLKPLGQRVCIIGGGGTGAALAYDLALRGFSVTLLEKGELTSGTTGRHHGQLHCGARYVLADRAIARECMEESLVLRRIVPQAIEYNGGLFVELDEDDAELEDEFVEACREVGIPAVSIAAAQALDLEPTLSPKILGAVRVPDGSFDAFRLPLSFFAAARALGADIRAWNEVAGLELSTGRVVAAFVIDRSSDPIRELRVEADYFVSASGAWAGRIGSLAGVDVPITPAPGTMVAVRARLCDMVVSHLHRAGDGDIIVPQRGLSIIGSTQAIASDPDCLLPPPEDIPLLVGLAAKMMPSFAEAPFHAAWCAARPLAGRPRPLSDGSSGDGRSISRDFAILDHDVRDGLAGFCSLIGGKATVLRAMARKAADLVCRSLGVEAECATADYSLPSWRDYYRGVAQGGRAR
ncbi:MAG: FAD-dependent oxidoreductase [Rectinemataceae bacterium]|jgi:glycerol-3-phosphate dehydrogenase